VAPTTPPPPNFGFCSPHPRSSPALRKLQTSFSLTATRLKTGDGGGFSSATQAPSFSHPVPPVPPEGPIRPTSKCLSEVLLGSPSPLDRIWGLLFGPFGCPPGHRGPLLVELAVSKYHQNGTFIWPSLFPGFFSFLCLTGGLQGRFLPPNAPLFIPLFLVPVHLYPSPFPFSQFLRRDLAPRFFFFLRVCLFEFFLSGASVPAPGKNLYGVFWCPPPLPFSGFSLITVRSLR